MPEPHDLNGFGGRSPADEAFEARLRAVRPPDARIDRDRLMYLAGRRSVAPPRRTRVRAFLAIVPWAACAVLAGLLLARPPKVVVETRVVERVIEVPKADVAGPTRDAGPPQSVAEARSAADVAVSDADLWPLGLTAGPLSVLSSRPAFRRGEMLASTESPAPIANDASAPPSPASYGELRRELLPDAGEGPAGSFRWF